MKFLLDENVQKRVADYLTDQGVDVKTTKGATDSQVAHLAQKEDRIPITYDSDFSNMLAYPPKDYPGIIILKIHPPILDKTTEALTRLLKKTEKAGLKGKTVILKEDKYLVTE